MSGQQERLFRLRWQVPEPPRTVTIVVRESNIAPLVVTAIIDNGWTLLSATLVEQ